MALFIAEQNIEMTTQLKNTESGAVILEECIVFHEFRDVQKHIAVLMELLHCLNPEYPKELKYTFKFIQKVIMDIGVACLCSGL